MKILLLSDPNSPHTIKWACSLAEKSIHVIIFGFGVLNVSDYDGKTNISVITLNQSIKRDESIFIKLKYLKSVSVVKKIIREFSPDIVHAHFASSYGIVGSLCNFKPFILSVWGNDVFKFPKTSIIHKTILKYNLKKASIILSTSYAMAKETQLYTKKAIEVTPFGIDFEQFKPFNVRNIFDNNDIVIGTIKSLEDTYGIEYLIKAFKIILHRYPQLPLKLLIVGGGNLEKHLKQLSKSLSIEDRTFFTGKIPYSEIPKYHNMLDVYVAVSNSESFGVAVIEASACEKPVVVSNVGGLPEVVEDGVTGHIVPPRDPEKTADAIEKLITDRSLAQQMGKAGRSRVMQKFNWQNNVDQMIRIYQSHI